MKFTYKSPFNPKNFKDFNPKKFKIYTFNSGFKKRKDDLLVIEFNSPASVFSVYSKTSTPSAPILWDKEHNKGLCKVLIVNSGNANAFTGKEGVKAIDEYVDFASKIFNCKKSNILVSSTGVIGEQINPKKITNKLKLLPQPTSKTLLSAAKSIMTTDTYPKIASETINYKSSKISINGLMFFKQHFMYSFVVNDVIALENVDEDLDWYCLSNNINITWDFILKHFHY